MNILNKLKTAEVSSFLGQTTLFRLISLISNPYINMQNPGMGALIIKGQNI